MNSWYPKGSARPRTNVKPSLSPEIAALAVWNNDHRIVLARWVRCPVCDGTAKINDPRTDMIRDCIGCNETPGKIMTK